jgi:hypothetical protein
MPTQPRSSAEHYQAAERLVAAAESSVTEQIQTTTALLALAHAVLAQAPRRARRSPGSSGNNSGSGLPAHLNWPDQ